MSDADIVREALEFCCQPGAYDRAIAALDRLEAERAAYKRIEVVPAQAAAKEACAVPGCGRQRSSHNRWCQECNEDALGLALAAAKEVSDRCEAAEAERDAARRACEKAIRERRSLEIKEDDWHSAYERSEARVAQLQAALEEHEEPSLSPEAISGLRKIARANDCNLAAALEMVVEESFRAAALADLPEVPMNDREMEPCELQAALTQLRDAWNAHMAKCNQDAHLVPTPEQIDAWAKAPSNTVSADLAGAPDE